MYQDEIFEQAKREAKETNLNELKSEVSEVERIIEKLLTQLLECSSSIAERDFNACAI